MEPLANTGNGGVSLRPDLKIISSTSSVSLVPDYLRDNPKKEVTSTSRWLTTFREWQKADPAHKPGGRFTETNLAYLMIHFAQGRIFYDPVREEVLFLELDGLREGKIAVWSLMGLMRKWLLAFLETIPGDVDEEGGSKEAKKLENIIRQACESLGRGKSLDEIGQILHRIMHQYSLEAKPLSPDEIPVQVVCQDGTLDIMVYSMATGLMRVPRLGENISQIPTEYKLPINFSIADITEADLQGSDFYRLIRNFFLGQELVEAKIEFFSRWMAYNLAMGNPEQKYTWWTGSSGTGKSLLLDTMCLIRGKLAALRMSPCTYQKGSKDPTGEYQRADLRGKAMSYSSEMSSGYPVDGEKLKADTDTEITARQIFKKPIQFTMTHSHIFLGNDTPVIYDPSNSVARRGIHIHTTGVMYEGRKFDDPHKKLFEDNQQVIFYFLRKGFDSLKKKGLAPLPEFSLESTDNKLEVSEEWFKDFWREQISEGKLIIDGDKEFISGILYKNLFLPWWNENYPKRTPPAASEFGKSIKSSNVAKGPRLSNGKSFYTGAEIVGHEVVVSRRKKVHHLSEADLDRLAADSNQ